MFSNQNQKGEHVSDEEGRGLCVAGFGRDWRQREAAARGVSKPGICRLRRWADNMGLYARDGAHEDMGSLGCQSSVE